jgi:hypothetical protein
MRDSIERRDSGTDDPVQVREGQIGPLHFRTTFAGSRPPSRLRLIALAIGALIIGGAFVALGLLLLAALVTTAALVGGGYLIYRRMRNALGGHRKPRQELGLDPSMEISAADPGDVPSGNLPRDRGR